MTPSESEVRALFDRRSEAMRAKDIDRLMPLYSPDIVYFDVVPPLQYVGSAALRSRFLHWFDGWTSAIGQEIYDLKIWTNQDVASASMLIRSGGILKSGQEVDRWVRTSNSCQRSNGAWLITHEHVSVPVDLASGRVVTGLMP